MTRQPLYIHGFGPVALTLAIGAQRLGFAPTLVGTPQGGRDLRAWSLLPRTTAFLDALGVAVSGQRVTSMHVWQADETGRALPGQLDFRAAPISTVVPGETLTSALQSASAAIPRLSETPAEALGPTTASLHLVTKGWPLTAPRPKMTRWGYGQSALTGVVAARGLGTRALQVFLPTGPLALLPLPEQGTASMIWSLGDEALRGLRQRGDLATLATATLASSSHASPNDAATDQEIEVDFDPASLGSFPLGAAHARRYVGPGYALVGDAAHRVHPLAGVGLNMGLGDVGALLDALVRARRTGMDLASLPALSPYERARRAENESLIVATDGLARLFGQGWGPLRLARSLGLSVVNRSGLSQQFQALMSDPRPLCHAIQA